MIASRGHAAAIYLLRIAQLNRTTATRTTFSGQDRLLAELFEPTRCYPDVLATPLAESPHAVAQIVGTSKHDQANTALVQHSPHLGVLSGLQFLEVDTSSMWG